MHALMNTKDAKDVPQIVEQLLTLVYNPRCPDRLLESQALYTVELG